MHHSELEKSILTPKKEELPGATTQTGRPLSLKLTTSPGLVHEKLFDA